MSIKFTFKVEMDGLTYTDYELELPAKHALAIQAHNDIATEIVKRLELHRLEVKPMVKAIPHRLADSVGSTPPKYHQHTQTTS